MKSNRRILAIATAMVVVLAACGSDDDPGTADTAATGTTADSVADTAAAPADTTATSDAPADTTGDTTGDTAASGDTAAPAEGVPTELGEGEGEVNLIAWAGYVEDGSTDPAVDWVTRLRSRHRMPGERQDRQQLRRDGAADADRRVRRCVGVG